MEKMTNVKALTALQKFLENSSAPVSAEFTNATLAEKVGKMIASYEKKASAPRKQTPAQAENELFRTHVMEILADGVPKSTAEIKEALGLPADTSPQRISGIMRPLVQTEKNPDGVVGTKEIKRKTHYFLLATEAED